jgi:hypothetical protein
MDPQKNQRWSTRESMRKQVCVTFAFMELLMIISLASFCHSSFSVISLVLMAFQDFLLRAFSPLSHGILIYARLPL